VKVVDDDGEATEMTVDMAQWKAMGPSLLLLAGVLDYPLAKVFLHCVSAGINVFVEDYSVAMQIKQMADFNGRIKRARP